MDTKNPTLTDKFALVLVSLFISKLEAQRGILTPDAVADRIIAAIVDCATDAGVDRMVLREACSVLLTGKTDTLTNLDAVNKIPC